jgi:hypothetical protein
MLGGSSEVVDGCTQVKVPRYTIPQPHHPDLLNSHPNSLQPHKSKKANERHLISSLHNYTSITQPCIA